MNKSEDFYFIFLLLIWLSTAPGGDNLSLVSFLSESTTQSPQGQLRTTVRVKILCYNEDFHFCSIIHDAASYRSAAM